MTEGKSTIKAEVRQVSGLTIAGKASSNHWIIMDTKEQAGGNEAGSTPMELVLMAAGGCTAMDMISLLKKMRIDYTDLKISLDGERTVEHPKVFTGIKLTYHIWGEDIPLEKVEKAVRLSQEKYCSVAGMLKNSVNVSYEIMLHQE